MSVIFFEFSWKIGPGLILVTRHDDDQLGCSATTTRLWRAMYDYDYSVPIPPQRRDSLSKATRDLMALEQPIKRQPPPALNPPPNPESPANHVKPTLSPSQKKANHIQSEQKRRANIRRGYEALCDAVPSLREALSNPPSSSSSSFITEPRKRRRTGNGPNDDKLDGRAGPKSENVVLGKSAFSFGFLTFD